MVDVAITVDLRKVRGLIRKLDNLNSPLSAITTQIARTLLAMIQRNIQQQGRVFGRWKGASKWFLAKNDDDQMFKGAERNVRLRGGSLKQEIYFVKNRTDKYSLAEHQQGFVEPGGGELVILDLKRPSALGTDNRRFAFRSVRPQKVPPRRMAPTQKQVDRIVNPMINEWMRKTERELAS
jgi:hypothetical protein